MEKTLIKKYSNLRLKIKELEEQEQELRVEILDEMDKNKLDKVESEYGNFTVGRRKTWVYSKKVEALEERVKIAKYKEQEEGVAESKETQYLVFKAQNDEK